MPAPLVGVVLAALLVSGAAGVAMAVVHPATANPCSGSGLKDSVYGAHAPSDQNASENETGDPDPGDLNDTGDLNATESASASSGCGSSDPSGETPDPSGISASVRFA